MAQLALDAPDRRQGRQYGTGSFLLRIGLIGCGDWGQNYARTLASLGVLGALADADGPRRERIAAQYGCRAMDSAALIADPSIEAVVAVLPPEHNLPAAMQVIAAGKHLLVEKPMALNAADAARLESAARAAGVVAMTGHLLRFHPAYRALEGLVESGALGTLRLIHSRRVGFGKFFAGGDVLWDLGPHDISIALALAGEAPRDVHLSGLPVFTGADDYAELALGFPSGLRVHTTLSRASPRAERSFAVIGTEAMAVVDELLPPAQMLALYPHRVWPEGGGARFERAAAQYQPLDDALPLTAEVEHFMDCIRTGRTPRASLAEGLEVIAVLDRATGGQGGSGQTAGLARNRRETAT